MIQHPVHNIIGMHLSKMLSDIEKILDSDVVTIFAPMYPNIESRFNHILNLRKTKREKLSIILKTNGGYSHTAERLVRTMRADYKEIYFIIPEYAMSAGTILALSGDKIYMDKDSALGPIDPQVLKKIGERDEWIPAVSYINKFNELIEKSKKKILSPAEYMLMEKQLNLAEIENFKQEIEYTKDLLRQWLSKYKFKDWIDSKTGKPKTLQQKAKRAEEIADILNDQKVWHNHSRQIHREILTDKVKLKIDKIEDNKALKYALEQYWILFTDFLSLNNIDNFLNSKEFFL